MHHFMICKPVTLVVKVSPFPLDIGLWTGPVRYFNFAKQMAHFVPLLAPNIYSATPMKSFEICTYCQTAISQSEVGRTGAVHPVATPLFQPNLNEIKCQGKHIFLCHFTLSAT